MTKTYSREFVPASVDMSDWDQIKPLFDLLDAQSIETVEQLEKWILDCSELHSCLSEAGNSRYVAMTCDTDNAEKEKAYLDFEETIKQNCSSRWNKIHEKYLTSSARSLLPKDKYLVYDRSVENASALFREENLPLQTQLTELEQKYQKTCGAMTVMYLDEERTLQQMDKYLLEPVRYIRKEAWEKIAERRLQDREVIDNLFDQMLKLRVQMATNAGFDNFRDYMFRTYERFDYTPKDCFAFHDTIEKLVVPIKRQRQEKRKAILGIDILRPWDLQVDPKGRLPLVPFHALQELYSKCTKIFYALDKDLGEQFRTITNENWLDADSRKGKSPGGYQITFEEERHPFIFMNAVGIHADVETLLHEGGHAFHYLACRDNDLLDYRHCGMEMAEVASMGMELLGYDHLDVFYRDEDLVRAKTEMLDGIINILCWIAIIDRFQHWIYLNPEHTRNGRTNYWCSLLDRFGGIESWDGYEAARESVWHRQLHIFEVPFYYIEYGIAQIGALQLWLNARKDKPNALRKYQEALALGGSRPLPELWNAAGLIFDFSEDVVRPLIELVKEELDFLENDS